MKRRTRRPGARYYEGSIADSSAPPGHLEAQIWTSPQQSPKPSSRWEWWERISLLFVVVGGLLAVLPALWPDARWPEMAVVTAVAALVGIAGILVFFVAYLRARTP